MSESKSVGRAETRTQTIDGGAAEALRVLCEARELFNVVDRAKPEDAARDFYNIFATRLPHAIRALTGEWPR